MSEQTAAQRRHARQADSSKPHPDQLHHEQLGFDLDLDPVAEPVGSLRRLPPPDQPARDRIGNDLDATLFVE
ncbi:MAG: hypothetical protein ABWZ99_16030, partial [Ilumatobacteraceae bacterium]